MNPEWAGAGRVHLGFIAQDVEDAMTSCNITDMEFAGLVKENVYELRCPDGEYNKNSNIIGIDYFLRYDEFIPLSFSLLQRLSERVKILESL